MANMFEYLKWRGDLAFTQDPVNSVDALIFSTLAYVSYFDTNREETWKAVKLRDAAQSFFQQESLEEKYRVKNDLELLRKAAETERFGNTELTMYRDELIPEQETQFAAMTFLLDDGSMFLAFRGTDNTLVGWKEDFNMSFQQTVPAQRLAVQYVREAAAEYENPIYLGGHSKGGNLAVFAAARSSPMVQRRIREVYNHDGPGFTSYLMGDPGYLAMIPQIRTFIPQSSVIGMLLEHEEPYTVIESKTVGLLQHDPYSWEILGKSFISVNEVAQSSQFLDATIKDWFSNMSNGERNQLVDVMFGILGTGGVDKALDIFHPRNIRNYLKLVSSDDNLRKILSSEFISLMEAAKRTWTEFEEKRLALEAGTEEPVTE